MQDVVQTIREAFEGVAVAPTVAPPADVLSDACSVYPVCVIHANMIANAATTGGDEYSLELMASDLIGAVQRIMARTPDSEQAVLILNGDTLDTDNAKGVTPRSGHIMHKEVSQYAATLYVIRVVRVVIGLLLEKHSTLRIRVMRGNHDESAHIAITCGLIGHYAQEPRVTVDDVERDLFQMQWGDCAIFAHHGDIPSKWERFALMLSDVCPFWSATHHRTCYFGHGHRDKEHDFGAVKIEMLRPFTPLNAHGAGLGFVQRRQLKCITYDKRDGPISTSLDPIRRSASGA